MTWNEPTTELMFFDKDTLSNKLAKEKEFFIPDTGFKFLDEHYGPRPGCIHTIMGATASGKSTLMQSLILQWGARTDLLVYLTEESQEKFEMNLYEKNKEAEFLSPHVYMIHERRVLRNNDRCDYGAMLKAIEKGIVESKAKLVIIDNLTTSAFYDGNISAAIPILSGLRSLAEHYKISIFIIVHTKKGVNESTKGMLEPDDVRGSANIANTSDYFYTFYRIGVTTGTGSKTISSFIYINKCRGHDTQGSMYRLNYKYENKTYYSDALVSFNTFKQFMKERDRL